MAKIIEYFITRSLFVNLLTILLIVSGGVVAFTMNREAFPNINFDIVIVTTIYPGASPDEVELQVTKPLEESIQSVDGIKEYRSGSIENRSGIIITIDPDVKDNQKVIDDLRAAIDRTEDLPDGSEKPIVLEMTSARQPVITFYLAREEKEGESSISERELRNEARILEDRLLNLKGVARVQRQGWRDSEIQVELNPNLLDRFYLSADTIVNSLRSRNINFPGGKIEHNGKEIIVRTLGEFINTEDILNSIIRSNDVGQHIQLRDVADVKEGFAESEYIEKADGYQAISLIVVKRESADAVNVVDNAKAIVDAYKTSAPKGIHVGYASDMSFFIRRRLNVLISNGIGGLILVIASLFFFLGWRSATMTALGIPISIAMAFIAMSYMGVTLNLISMFGLIVVIGLIVDDAIIVCENVYRYIENGMPVYDAVVTGTKEVISPVIATVATTVAAFGPLLFVTGIMGKFIMFIPLTVILALLASLLECFFILPSHLYDINKNAGRIIESHKGEGWFASFRKRYYEPSLSWALSHKTIVIAGLLLAFAGSIGAQVNFGKFKLFPGAIDAFQIKLAAEKGLTKEETEKFARVIEYEILKLPADELENAITRVGITQKDGNDPFTRRGSNYAQVMVYLTPEQTRKRKTREITADIRQKTEWLLNEEGQKKSRKQAEMNRPVGLDAVNDGKKNGVQYEIPPQFESLKGRLVNLEIENLHGGPPVGKPVAVEIIGENFKTLMEIGEEFKKVMSEMETIADIDDDYEEGKDEMRFVIDEKRAAQAGVTVSQVALAINTAYQGTVATSIKRAEEEVDIRVRFAERYRNTPDSWGKIQVRNMMGNLIPISSIATYQKEKGITAINHLNGKRLLTVTATTTKGTTSDEANKWIQERTKNIAAKYSDYIIQFGGEHKDTEESMASLRRSFGVGLLIIFLILSSLFNSVAQPLVVLSAIPFSIIGVIIAFLTHGHPLSFLSIMGIVGLSGVVVNDSIVLVTFANTIRNENPHLPIREVVLQAGSLRLRAVILTTVTTVFGLIPTAYGLGGLDPFLVPMALAFSWGLMFATFLTLILVPILYMIEHDSKRWLKKRLRSIMHSILRKIGF